MQKRSRWLSILAVITGTGFLLWNAIVEQEKQAERNRAAERFTETAILFREADDDWLLDCYPEGMGEDFLSDLRETARNMDFGVRQALSMAEFSVVEDRRIDEEELKKLEELPEEAGKAAEAYQVKVRLSFPGTEQERILEYLMLEYNGHYGVFGIDAEGMKCYLWEERDKILLEKVSVRSDGSISDREEYRYDAGGRLDMIIIHRGFDDTSRKKCECEYDPAGRLAREIFYENREKREVRYEYEEDGFGKQRERQYELRYEAIYDDAENRYWEYVGGGLKSVVKYDGNKNPIDEIVYGDDKNAEARWIYEYDEEGRKTGSDCWRFYDDGSVWRRERYDSEDRLVDEIRYDQDGGMFEWIRYEYNRFGNIARSICYNEYGDREETEYDSVGNILVKTYYTYGGKRTRRREYQYTYDEEYDVKGKLIRKNGYDEKGKLVYVCEYDEAGQAVRETGYDKKRIVLHKYEYDSSGNLILEVHHGTDKTYDAQEYNGRGVLKREYCYSYKGYKKYKAVTEREYDAWGNVFRESEYRGRRKSR